MINFLEWVELYREFGDGVDSIVLKNVGDGEMIDHPFLDKNKIWITFRMDGNGKRRVIIRTSRGEGDHGLILQHIIPIMKILGLAIAKLLKTNNPPALDLRNVFNIIDNPYSERRGGLAGSEKITQAKVLTAFHAILQRAIQLSGKDYRQFGSSIIGREELIGRSRADGQKAVQNLQASDQEYGQKLDLARQKTIDARQRQKSNVDAAQDAWKNAPPIGTRSRRRPMTLPATGTEG